MTSLNNFYIPHYNSFAMPMLGGEPYTLLLACLMFVFVLFLKNARTKDVAIFFICVLLITSVLFQFIGQWDYRTRLSQQMSYKSFAQKKAVLLGDAFNLAYCAQSKLKGRRYQGEFISDLGTSSLVPSIFRYELYPVIDLASNAPDPQVRVCYDSGQCSQVPEDLHPVCQDENGYVALRGGASAQDHHSL